ncbi:hypothetical protein Nepgr_009316 [Nepenthes gracilis]|uniref:Uncharacterized protein n=1 Tax=Nepenthes gracilis TaxID=150966 RepID=A0AAD3SB40_NEPGR|nr:hypothetical protein Nepgr_009316 [Nepenthes gracilis]
MRVLSCKIHCPFTCFCKPSLIYKSGPLKLENAPHAPQPLVYVSDAPNQSGLSDGERIEFKTGNPDGKRHQPQQQPQLENGLKSSLRKRFLESEDFEKKKVQWVDLLGKELAEIKEFDSSEAGDTHFEGVNSRACLCNIL